MHMQMATALKRTWGGCKVVPLGSRKSKLGSVNMTVLSLACLSYAHRTSVIEICSAEWQKDNVVWLFPIECGE